MIAVRRALTLIELLVVLVLIGVLAGIAGLTFRTITPPTQADALRSRLEEAQDSATRFGRRVTISLRVGESDIDATALPDGRMITDTTLASPLGIGEKP